MENFAAGHDWYRQVMPAKTVSFSLPDSSCIRGKLEILEDIMTTQVSVSDNEQRMALSRRLEDFGWAVLLIAVGTIWLMPEKVAPKGSWLIAAGIIMLGLNAIRWLNGIRMRGFSLFAGVLALLAGLGEFFGLKLPLFAIALIMIGASILVMRLVEKDSVSTADASWCCCGPREAKQDAMHGKAAGC